MPTHVGPFCKHFQKNNFQDHICDARYALIGEAPGSRENESGIPFIGPSGYDLEKWWHEAGLKRSEFYIDNCYPHQPPGNKLHLIPRDHLKSYSMEMLLRLRRTMPNVSVLVPTGNTALRSIFGDNKMAITDWRGSILNWEGKWCIPTIHPAATQRQKILTKLCVADWKRIAYVGKWGHTPVKRHHIVDPDLKELLAFREAAWEYFSNSETQLPPRVLSVDVENDIKTKKLLCAGFSFDPKVSITVSTVRSDYDSDMDFANGQAFIVEMLKSPFLVVGQNYMTDLWKLTNWAPEIKQQLIDNYIWDLIEMDHALDPNDGGPTGDMGDEMSDDGLKVGMRDLGTLASLYTKEPFYKHEGGSWSQEKRWIYNGKDACVQREIFDVLWWKLYERGLV